MFEPAVPQKSIPVLADPPANGRLAQVAAGLLALNPLEPLRFLFAASMKAHPAFGGKRRNCHR
jgi:hypothetical protein